MFRFLKQYFNRPLPEPSLLFSKVEMGPTDILIIHLPTAIDHLNRSERTQYTDSIFKVVQSTPTLDSRRVWVVGGDIKVSVISQAEARLVLGT